jgi:hypothetical protein
LAGAIVVAAALPTVAGADSFDPITLSIKVAASGHLRSRLPITVGVTADPGVLDARTAPLRVLVKLAPECGGSFQYTPGVTLLNRRLSPQPATGRAYTASVTGAGTPLTRGVQTVCVWLAEEGDGRVFASDQSNQVDVLRALPAKPKKRKRSHRR